MSESTFYLGIISVIVGFFIIAILNKFLWAWYLEISTFKSYQKAFLNESKKQTALLKLLCEEKGIDISSIDVPISKKT